MLTDMRISFVTQSGIILFIDNIYYNINIFVVVIFLLLLLS
ncbi:MAG: hypothetical protein P857_204 [Candidatus Xenolissoclinum pacificiensis L6]|uniref:Uncharacterized protein n=1 Tax=Candidatus Xenolissoclinum pacificiensis L6 TaxID=1401685 RepID=W2UZG4_9RICK|nr:MAG: hypothetical protein P857_204 [Candidatus Xenolissoclinum pacificiensis L6]